MAKTFPHVFIYSVQFHYRWIFVFIVVSVEKCTHLFWGKVRQRRMGMHIIFFISPHYLILCILFALCEQILYRHTCAIILLSYIASLILSYSKCPCRIFLTYLQDCQVKIGVKTKYTEK